MSHVSGLILKFLIEIQFYLIARWSKISSIVDVLSEHFIQALRKLKSKRTNRSLGKRHTEKLVDDSLFARPIRATPIVRVLTGVHSHATSSNSCPSRQPLILFMCLRRFRRRMAAMSVQIDHFSITNQDLSIRELELNLLLARDHPNRALDFR